MLQRAKWLTLPLTVLLLAGCGGAQKTAKAEEPLSPVRAYRTAYNGKEAEVREGLDSGQCSVKSTCGELSFVDCGQAADGPAYFVKTGTYQVLEVCGGACMAGPRQDMCVACPPPEWTCAE